MLTMLLSLFAAFPAALLPIIGSGDATAIAAVLFSWLGQWAKGNKGFPTLATEGIMLGIGFALYWLSHPYGGAEGWLRDGLLWSSGLPGLAGITSRLGIAPRTDSI